MARVKRLDRLVDENRHHNRFALWTHNARRILGCFGRKLGVRLLDVSGVLPRIVLVDQVAAAQAWDVVRVCFVNVIRAENYFTVSKMSANDAPRLYDLKTVLNNSRKVCFGSFPYRTRRGV